MKFSKERLRELRREALIQAADTQAILDRDGLLTATEAAQVTFQMGTDGMQVTGPSPVLSKLLRKLKSHGAKPDASSNAG